MRMNAWAVAGLVAGAGLAGCQGFESTYVGNAASGTEFNGVPIVVQRAKLVKVVNKKTTYALVKTDTQETTRTTPTAPAPSTNGRPVAPADEASENTSRTTVAESGARETLEEVSIELVTVPEVFTVDIKRPAAGTATNYIEFEPGQQFPKKYSMDVEDKTIDAVGDLVGKLADAAKKFVTASARGAGQVQSVKVGETVTRIRLYRIEDFLAVHGDSTKITPVFDSDTAK